MFQTSSLSSTPTFRIILGLGLCSLGGAMLYTYFRSRNNDDDDEDDGGIRESQKARRKQMTTKEITITLSVSNEHIPLIAGRNGSNLSLIEERTRASIKFRDKNETHKYCDISGTPNAVKEAREMMLKEIERSPIVKEEIYVPANVCGKIVGRCGESIQEICRISLAKVSVDSGDMRHGSNMDKRCITITGNRQQVNIARKLLEEKIQEDVEARRVVESVEQHREPRRSPTNSMCSSLYSSQTSLSSHTQLPPREKLIATTNCDEKPMEVYVSACASPLKFWVQLIGPQSKRLDDLVQAMTDYYNESENREKHHITEPYLGQIVATVFKNDDKWYRAEIVGILPNQYNVEEVVLDLYFVDYGDSEYVRPHEVFELRTDFLTLRFQAVECFLANIKSTLVKDSETWEIQSIQKFEELTQVGNWKRLTTRVVTYKERPKFTNGAAGLRTREGSPVPGVELFDTSEDYEVNIGDVLISQGLALPLDKHQRSCSPNLAPAHAPALLSNEKNLPQTNCSNVIKADNFVLEQQERHLNKNMHLNGDPEGVSSAEQFDTKVKRETNENVKEQQRIGHLLLDSNSSSNDSIRKSNNDFGR